MKILIMGLPGAGKTTLASKLITQLKSVMWLNADKIRELYDDWDFSHEGRIRQAKRMAVFANISDDDYVIADFVAPIPEMRELFNADFTIWVDTIKEGRFEDTNKAFIPPQNYDIRITDYNYSIDDILEGIININNKINTRKSSWPLQAEQP